MKPQIGAQYFTIREFCQTLKDFDASCKKIHEIGYRTVQLSGIGNFTGEEVKEILNRYQLTAVCTHRNGENYLHHTEDEIAFHKTIDCKVAGIGIMPHFDPKVKITREQIKAFANSYRPVAEEMKKHDIVFAYHNHALEFAKIDGEYVFDILLQEMDCDNFQLILDVYWLAIAGIDPAKFIREHGKRIACVHLKDLKIVGKQAEFAEIGQGNLNWDDILSACEESGVAHAVVEQDTCEGDPFDSLKISYDYLHRKGLL